MKNEKTTSKESEMKIGLINSSTISGKINEKTTSILFDKINSLIDITVLLRIILVIGLIYPIYGILELNRELNRMNIEQSLLIYIPLLLSTISVLLLFLFFNRLSSVLCLIEEEIKNKNK